eukprot:sb/3470234/
MRFIRSLAIQSNVVTKLHRVAQALFEDGEHDKALLLYLTAAEAGIEMSQYNVAWLCQEFELKYKIDRCSERYYRASALNGYGPSQAITGNNLYREGRYRDAAVMYGEAAGNNVDEGLFGLGHFSRHGQPVGIITINSTSYYFGPEPNRTLTWTLWSQCFHMGSDAAVIGCGIPLILEFIQTITLQTVSCVIAPAFITVFSLSFWLSRGV